MALSKTIPPTAADLQRLLSEFAGHTPEDVVRGLISLTPTRHRAELGSGTRLFTYCTLDTLLIPRLLGEDARLSSAPPGAAAPLHYAIAGGELQVPGEWVMSFPQIRPGDAGEFKGNFCPYANAFASAQGYAAWAAGAGIATQFLSLAQADALARDYAEVVMREAPKVCGCGCGL
ncbi:organomercurial lyase [Deinococcus lacus]|uniref:Organomercurial lyase n=1 Tax=Deinococcus lacus TaxID=392561 RepID=A0ABW1YG29_9DEIO